MPRPALSPRWRGAPASRTAHPISTNRVKERVTYMSCYPTHKGTPAGKAETLARKAARRTKYATSTPKNGR